MSSIIYYIGSNCNCAKTICTLMSCEVFLKNSGITRRILSSTHKSNCTKNYLYVDHQINYVPLGKHLEKFYKLFKGKATKPAKIILFCKK